MATGVRGVQCRGGRSRGNSCCSLCILSFSPLLSLSLVVQFHGSALPSSGVSSINVCTLTSVVRGRAGQGDARFRAREARVSFALTRADSSFCRADSGLRQFIYIYISFFSRLLHQTLAPKIEHQDYDRCDQERCVSMIDRSVLQVT